MTKSFAIIFSVISLTLVSIVWAQLININEVDDVTQEQIVDAA